MFAEDERVQILRAPSLDAAQEFEEASLDAVYIDGYHGYQSVQGDLAAWWPKLKPGGLMTGDDFYWTADGGKSFPVRRAVKEFLKQNRTGRWAAFRGQFVIERPH